jgi:class 3 adenylate cyclase
MTKIKIYFLLFTLLNLAFIPLIALYGLRVCPILNFAGFYLGCSYSSIFISLVTFTNFVFLTLIIKNPDSRLKKWGRKSPTWFFAGIYVASILITLILIIILFYYLNIPLRSRAPEVLILASLLLALTQVYGTHWALGETEFFSVPKSPSFRARWSSHLTRSLLPLFVMIIVLTHFFLRQSTELNHGHVAPQLPIDGMISNTILLLLFLFAWLILTYSFHFLGEQSQLTMVQAHLRELSNFNLNYQTQVERTWGIWSLLLEQLNLFSIALGERNRLLKTFSRFVTKEVAQVASQSEIKEASGENKELTVIMSDIRNFTAISEKLSPTDVVNMLNRYFTAMLDEFSKHTIVVDKFIGDGILAYVETENDHQKENSIAVSSALAMLRRMLVLNEEESEYPQLQIGIGIYRGPVVMGFIGSEAKLQHTIIGDTVNRVARLEGLCKEMGSPLVISNEVWKSLDSRLKNRL